MSLLFSVYLEWVHPHKVNFLAVVLHANFECFGILVGELTLSRRLLLACLFSSLFLSWLLLISQLYSCFCSQYSQDPSSFPSTGVLGFPSHGDTGVTGEIVAGPEGGLAQVLPWGVCRGNSCLGFLVQQVVWGGGRRECNLVPVPGSGSHTSHETLLFRYLSKLAFHLLCCSDPRIQLWLLLFISVVWKKCLIFLSMAISLYFPLSLLCVWGWGGWWCLRAESCTTSLARSALPWPQPVLHSWFSLTKELNVMWPEKRKGSRGLIWRALECDLLDSFHWYLSPSLPQPQEELG